MQKKVFERFFISSWWVFAVLAFCFLFHCHAMRKKDELQQELEGRITDLKKTKEDALVKRDDLNDQINSQSDPAWIEMTLIKGLGVVPEGQVKVYFKKE